MEKSTRTLSPSSMENWRACARKGWFRSVLKVRTPQSEAAQRGDLLHKAVESYLQDVPGWNEMPYAPGAVAAQRLLPAPGVAEIELWAPRVPLTPETVFTGRVDLLSTPESRQGRPLLAVDGAVLADGDTLWIGDHKSKSSNKYLKSPEELAEDLQMLAYAAAFQREGVTAATKVSVAHFYYVYPKNQTAPEAYKPQVLRVCASVTPAALQANWEAFEQVAALAEPLYAVKDQDEVPANLARCSDYGGCDFAGICNAAKGGTRAGGLGRALSNLAAKAPAPVSSRVVNGPRQTPWHDYEKATQGEKPTMAFAFPGGKKPAPTPAPVSTPAATPAPDAAPEDTGTIARNEPAVVAPESKTAVVPPDAPASVTPSIAQWIEFNRIAKAPGTDLSSQAAVVAILHRLSLPTEPSFVDAAMNSAMGLLNVPGNPNPFDVSGSAAVWAQTAWNLMRDKGVQVLPVLALATAVQRPDTLVSTVVRAICDGTALSSKPLLCVGTGSAAWLVRNPHWNGQPAYPISAAPPQAEAAKEAFGTVQGVAGNDWHIQPPVIEAFKAWLAGEGGRAGKVAPVIKDIVNRIYGSPEKPHVSSVRTDRIKGLCAAAGLVYDEASGVVSDPSAPLDAAKPAPAPAPAPAPKPTPAPSTPISTPIPSGVTPFPSSLYVGCWPEDMAVQDLMTSTLLIDAIAKVEADEGVAHYSLVKFAQGPAQVAGLVKMALRQNLIDMQGAWFLSRREDALSNALIPIFKAAGWRIVRCVG